MPPSAVTGAIWSGWYPTSGVMPVASATGLHPTPNAPTAMNFRYPGQTDRPGPPEFRDLNLL